ncbi:MAG: hypothetical protein AAF563_12010 [Pseudomonadota bacterium]
MNNADVVARELGPQEVLLVELNRRCNGAVQLVAMVELREPMDVGDLRRALKVIHGRHPLMRGRIEARDNLWWVCDVPFETIEIRTERLEEPFDMEAIYAREAAIVHDVADTAWRLVVLTDDAGRARWLILVTNHAAIDGRSALVVFNEIDKLVRDPNALDHASLPLTEAPERGLAAAGLKGEAGIFAEWPDQASWPVDAAAPAARRRPHAMLRVLPKADLQALHDRLHGEGVHLAAAFCAAAVRAGPALPGHTAWTGIVEPTDVRADCNPAIPGTAVGEFVAAINIFAGPEHDDLSTIALARAMGEMLRDNRPASLMMETDVPLDVTIEQVDQIAAPSDRFASGICVSDVGDLDRLSGRPVGIGRILIMPSQNHGVHPIMVAIVSTSEGACLSFGYDQPLRGRDAANAFADRYVDVLRGMARGA